MLFHCFELPKCCVFVFVFNKNEKKNQKTLKKSVLPFSTPLSMVMDSSCDDVKNAEFVYSVELEKVMCESVDTISHMS